MELKFQFDIYFDSKLIKEHFYKFKKYQKTLKE